MSKRQFRLPSPALVISMVALALVLGGTAVAATVGTHADARADTKLIKKLAPSLSVKNAKTVGGKQVKQFFADQPPNTANTTIFSVDGVKLKALCGGTVDPELTVENDSGQGAMFGGYSSAASGNWIITNFNATPVDLNDDGNGGGFFTVQLRTGVVVSVQWAATNTLGGTVTHCYFSGSVIAS
jgi:hypothetical protein